MNCSLTDLRQHCQRLRGLRRGGDHRRLPAIARAVAVATAGLGMCLLPGCHGNPALESGPRAMPTGNTCTSPAVISMESKDAQRGTAVGGYYVTNDSWNAAKYSELSQSIYVCDYDSWYVIATMNNDNSDGAVKTSPNVQRTWYPRPTKLSDWESITSHYSDVPPGAGPRYGTWEFEYDVWLNGLADSKSTEVMIWTYDNGQAPGGSLSGSFTSAGHTYDVYYSAPPYQYVAFVDRNGALAANVDLLAFFRYVIARGWMPASSTLFQICHGVELVSTNNKPEKFAINDFSISMLPDS